MPVSLCIVIKNHKWFLFLLTLFSCMVRIVFFVSFTRHGDNALIPYDSAQYLTIAQNIAAGNGIALEDGAPQMYRVPGYPLFLAMGMHALWIQIIFASLIPLLIFLLGMTLSMPVMLVKIAACIASVHLGFVVYAGMVATESLFCLLFLLFLIYFFSSHYFFAGLALGCASLVRPVGLPVLIAAVGMMMVWRVWYGFLAPFVLSWLLVVTPWLIRNFFLTGSILFHTLPGIHCVQYLAAPIVVQRDAVDYATARAHVMQEWYEQSRGDLNDVESCRVGERIAWSYVKQYPLYALKHAAGECFKTCCGLYSAIILLADKATWPSGYESASWLTKIRRFLLPVVQRPFLAPLIYWDILLTIFIMLGFWLCILFSLFDQRLWNYLWQIAPFIALFIALTFAYGGARFRLPIEPLLIFGAVYGWGQVWKKE